jgi:hypothetical protein
MLAPSRREERVKRTISKLALASLLALGAAGRARGDTVVEYLGPHPIDAAVASGMCYIPGPHVHAYAPSNPVLYAHVDGGWAFIGDPVEFEHDAPRYGYYGHHPIFWVDAPELYCYITGPHYHWDAPPPGAGFKQKGGVYWYTGEQPGWYRPTRDLDEHYAAVRVVHPVVNVAPPVGFVGVVVGLPSVTITAPSVTIGVPGVVVGPAVPVIVPEERENWHGHGRGHWKKHGRGKWED